MLIQDNERYLKEFLEESLIRHRLFYKKWSEITSQTATLKTGYLGQHLASLITGVKGSFTGARGDDLSDGTEVKTCTRIDQLDKCRQCKAPTPRYVDFCLKCGSKAIDRKNDSKWLFPVKNTNDLKLLTEQIPRVLLILFDYPHYEKSDFSVIDIKSYEILPSHPRHIRFKELISQYYLDIYLKSSNSSPAPKNLWPDSYQFHLCNPIKTFHARIENDTFSILKYIEPNTDRQTLETEKMPSKLLNSEERKIFTDLGSFLSEDDILKLSIRESKTFSINTKHQRGSLINERH
jgi:hypothetical protein